MRQNTLHHLIHFESACDFFFQFKDTTLEGPYEDIKFMAAKHFFSQTYVTYRKAGSVKLFVRCHPLSIQLIICWHLAGFRRAATEKKKTSEPGDKGAMRERTLPHDVFDDRLVFVILL